MDNEDNLDDDEDDNVNTDIHDDNVIITVVVPTPGQGSRVEGESRGQEEQAAGNSKGQLRGGEGLNKLCWSELGSE